MKIVSNPKCGTALRTAVIAVAGVAVAALATTAVRGASAQGRPVRILTVPGSSVSPPDRLVAAVDRRPIRFEPNVGQTASRIKYLARANGYMIGVTERGLILKLEQPGACRPLPAASPIQSCARHADARPTLVSMRPIRAKNDPLLRPEERLGSISNYFIGDNPKHWHTRIPNYAAVRYRNIYPGIDWIVYGNPNQLEYDLVVAPDTNPRQIQFKITGAKRISLDPKGDLAIKANNRTLHALKPLIYQITTAGKHHAVAGHYVLDGERVSFALGAYNHAHSLVIDPTFAYSTYLGGNGNDFATAVAVDDFGNAYVTGNAGSTNFPTSNPFQATNKGNNIFISKFNASGSALVYSTYLGGTNGGEDAHGIAVDSAGDAYVTGSTFARDFPTVNAFQPNNKSTGSPSAPPEQTFVTKLNSAGDALIYSTYLGGSNTLNGSVGIAVDGSEHAYVVGDTNSADFPTINPFQGIFRGRLDAFVTEFSATGNSLVYSTYLGGSAAQTANAVAVDDYGDAYVTGTTNSTDFPLVNPYQATNSASVNSTTETGFVTKFGPAGTVLAYSTYLGGSSDTTPRAIAVDQSGDAYVAGFTSSADFPVVNPFQSQLLGSTDAFVTKFNASGNALAYSTYLGAGDAFSQAFGIAVGSAGNAWVVGNTASTDFPTLAPLQATNKAALAFPGTGATDGFVTEFNAAGSALVFSTYLGGSGSWGPTSNHTPIPFDDSANAVALDNYGNVYVVGTTGSADFPMHCALQAENKTATTYGTADNAFVTKIAAAAPGSLPCPSPSVPAGNSRSGGGAIGGTVLLTLVFIVLFRKREIRKKPK
ncbi:MAG: SBBP repeat-containing protein [Gammaproteobacteria bacterium]|nr:SBBP repeat-containing protein [Gammaproteobacteria bacterium]MBU6508788.1 SBBP repeat-containing protein [Gammaproteobacteria bacterium]MDE1983238.1 SBBP repeat-containing protein [Gammaproteobacteria bacterium]MDE2107963.1 SBBP repeat-containing protein [Gammaproteobacteria bacterium]MDE2462053.1 SBBP repeat-containing protein [Gammaproteobacteria bacterium]